MELVCPWWFGNLTFGPNILTSKKSGFFAFWYTLHLYCFLSKHLSNKYFSCLGFILAHSWIFQSTIILPGKKFILLHLFGNSVLFNSIRSILLLLPAKYKFATAEVLVYTDGTGSLPFLFSPQNILVSQSFIINSSKKNIWIALHQTCKICIHSF